MTFEQWKEEYGLVHEPNYSVATEADCLAAWKAGQKAILANATFASSTRSREMKQKTKPSEVDVVRVCKKIGVAIKGEPLYVIIVLGKIK